MRKNRDISVVRKAIGECVKNREFTFEITEDEANDLLKEYASLVYSCLETTLEMQESGVDYEKIKEMKAMLENFAQIKRIYYKVI